MEDKLLIEKEIKYSKHSLANLRIIYTTDLFRSCQRFILYTNQPTDLLCKSMDWFLYDRDLRRERVNAQYFHNKNSQELQHKSYNFRIKPKETKLVTKTIY